MTAFPSLYLDLLIIIEISIFVIGLWITFKVTHRQKDKPPAASECPDGVKTDALTYINMIAMVSQLPPL